MTRLFFFLLRREWLLSSRSGADFFSVFFFFLSTLMVSSFFLSSLSWVGFDLPLVLGWMCCLSTYFLSLERYYSRDWDDGSYEFYLTLSTPFSFFLFTKSFAHWMFHGIPISLASFLFFVFFSLPSELIPWVPFTFFAGTFLLSQLSTLGFFLTSRLRYRGSILSFLLLPFCFPIMILGLVSVFWYLEGTSLSSLYALYGGIVVLSSVFCSFFGAFLVRSSLET